jgi:hypothetical protein
LGYAISQENGAELVHQLAGSAAPGGDTAEQDASPIGSSYQRTNGEFYTKIANAGALADWELKSAGINSIQAGYTPANGTVTVGDTYDEAFEKVDGNQQDIQTSSGLSQGDVNYGTFTGTTIPDSSTSKGAFQSLETAYEETDANVDDLVTLSGVAENSTDLGTFTGTTIPDNSTNKAALQSIETSHETLSTSVTEIDGNVDDLITLSGVAENSTDLGTFTGTTIPDSSTNKVALQSLETAHEEVDANVNDLITLSGVSENATDLGTFTGSTIPDSSTNKAALQSLETALELIEGGFAILVSGITTLQDIDTVLVDDVHSAEWEIVAWEEATPANKVFQKITALHNGTASADATVPDDSVHTKLKVGSNFNLVVAVDLNGAAGAQVMRLRASSSTAGVAMEVRRTGILVNS